MFGGLCLWHQGLAFALVIDEALYFKVDDHNRIAFEQRGLPQVLLHDEDGAYDGDVLCPGAGGGL